MADKNVNTVTSATAIASGDSLIVSKSNTTLQKIDYNLLAKAIIEQYTGTTLANNNQTLKQALDALNSKQQTSVQIIIGDVSADCSIYRIGNVGFLNLVVGNGNQFSTVVTEGIIGTLPTGFRPKWTCSYVIIARDDGIWSSASYYPYLVMLETNGNIKFRGNQSINTMKYINTTIAFPLD